MHTRRKDLVEGYGSKASRLFVTLFWSLLCIYSEWEGRLSKDEMEMV